MITLKQLKSKLETDFGWSNLECEENQWLIDNLLEDAIKAINVIQCCKSDSELLPSKDDVYSEIKRVTELYYNDDNARKSSFGLGFSTGVNFVNKDILK